MTSVPDRLANDLELLVRRHGDIEDFDCRLLQHLAKRLVNLRYPSQVRYFTGNRGRFGHDARHVVACLGVGFQVHLAHDKASADSSDAEIAATGLTKGLVQI